MESSEEPEMQDEDKTKAQLIIELYELRKRVAESEKDKEGRKRAEEALRHSQQMLLNHLDTCPGKVFWKDLNPVFARILKQQII